MSPTLRPTLLAALALAMSCPACANAQTMQLDHVALHVADVAASVRFYRGTLGLSEIPSRVPGKRWIGHGEHGGIHLAGGRTGPVAADDDVHFAIAVRALEPVMARLRAHGGVWVGSNTIPYGVSTVRRDGVRQIYFKDPDGYWVEVNDALRAHR